MRTVSCEDYAYRPDSPERRGEAGYACNADCELDDIANGDTPFYCHQGIRKPIKLRHPSGVEIAGHPASDNPPIVDGVPFRANGKPAEIGAGWAAHRRIVMSETRPGTPWERFGNASL